MCGDLKVILIFIRPFKMFWTLNLYITHEFMKKFTLFLSSISEVDLSKFVVS